MPDWSEVEELVREYVRLLEEEDYLESDTDQRVMEAALTAVYGEEIFERINPIIIKVDA